MSKSDEVLEIKLRCLDKPEHLEARIKLIAFHREDSVRNALQGATGDALTWQYWRDRARAAEEQNPRI